MLISCSRNRLNIDTSNIKVNLKVYRFDTAIAAINKDSIERQMPKIIATYGTFTQLYSVNIIKVGSTYSSEYANNLKLFFSYDVFSDINENIQNIFGKEHASFEPELTEAFKHVRYYFPDKQIPTIYTFNGGFNQSIVIDSAIIGIGLDKYLGTSNPLYKRLEMEQFKKEVMYPKKVVSDCMYAFAQSEFPFNFATENLLSTMIDEGRKMYVTKAMLPATKDTIIWGFSSKQMKFCEKHEKDMWEYLINNKLLFSSDYMNIKHFTGEGPFTTAFSKESPAKAACWVGYRIVCAYLDNNSNVTLSDLMKEVDFQKIMNKSKYKP